MSLEASLHSDAVQYGTFMLDEQVFGVDILRMREIIRLIEITKVPRAEHFVEGVINLRGVVIPIISLRSRFGMAPRAYSPTTRIINVEIEKTVVGFIVDAIGHVQRFSAGSIEPPPPVTMSASSEYILGIARGEDTLFTILDVDKLVAPEVLMNYAQE